MTVTTHTPRSLQYRIPTRFVRTATVSAGLIAVAAFGLFAADGTTGSDVPAVIAEVQNTECVVRLLAEPTGTTVTSCPPNARVGDITSVPIGGIWEQQIATGMSEVLLAIGLGGLVIAATTAAILLSRRRSEREVSEICRQRDARPAATAPARHPAYDEPVYRDRWRQPPPPPGGTARVIPSTSSRLPTVLGAIAGVVTLTVIAWDFAVDSGVDHPAFVAAGIASIGIVWVWRVWLLTVRWLPVGVRVQSMLRARVVPWADIDHVSVLLRRETSKSGRYWVVVPILVTRDGEQIPIPVLSRYSNKWRALGVRSAGTDIDTLDVWLDLADVPVDAAYDTYRAWQRGMVPIEDVVSATLLEESPPHLVSADIPAGAEALDQDTKLPRLDSNQ